MTEATSDRGTLALIAELQKILTPATSNADAKRRWELVQLIEGSLDSDARYSKQERQIVANLKSGVSNVIAAHRDGLNPVYSLALIPLYALNDSIMRRTIGLDGWPMKS